MRGKPPFIAFAQAKAGVRYLAQSMAREYGPRGLHVAHVVIDGGVDGARLKELIKSEPSPKGRISVDSTAETMWQFTDNPSYAYPGLTREEKTERGRKTSKGASRRSRPLVDVFTCDVA